MNLDNELIKLNMQMQFLLKNKGRHNANIFKTYCIHLVYMEVLLSVNNKILLIKKI